MSTRIKVGTIYVNNSTGQPVAGGAATGESTTPWAVREDRWTLQAAPPVSAWGGGPPFVPGRTLMYQSYDDVTERVPLLLDGTSHDDAANELQVLRRELLLGQATEPTILEIKPDGATNSMYALIKTGWLQEEGILESPSGGALRMRVALTIVRTPFFGQLSTGETVLNAVSFGNTGTGSPDDIAPFSAGSGDLIYEGQPINIFNINVSSFTIQTAYMGSIQGRTYGTNTTAISTTSTTGVFIFGVTVDLATAITNKALKLRVLWRITTPSANLQVRVKIGVSGGLSVGILFTGAWVSVVGTDTTLLDLGGYDLDFVRVLGNRTAAPTVYLQFDARSSNGSSATGTSSSYEWILYYDWCQIHAANPDVQMISYLNVSQFPERSGIPCLPYPAGIAFGAASSGGGPNEYLLVRGTLPRYFSGAQLYFSYLEFGGLHTTTRTATITATQCPLWRTMRGAD